MNINYNQRRQQLLSDKQGPCAAILFSGRAPMRSADGAYEFSVDRDFYYMTGIDHANMILMLTKDYAGNCVESLYIEPYDPPRPPRSAASKTSVTSTPSRRRSTPLSAQTAAKAA